MSDSPTSLPANSQPISLSLQPVKLDHERMMDCIHCGLCLSQCPTYAEDGVEADSPRGRIYLMRALAEGRVEATPDVTKHFDSCLGCRACETACPSGVQYGHLLENVRAHLRQTAPTPLKKSLIIRALESSFPYPDRLDMLLVPIRFLRKSGIMNLLHRSGFMKMLGNLGEMESMLPALGPTRRHRKFAAEFPARGEQQAQVGMLTGCVMPVMQGHVNDATARVLSKAGCKVQAPKGQSCCGALHAHSGDLKTAHDLARHNIALFEQCEREHGEFNAIIVNAAGCGAAMKEYEGWLRDDPAWKERAEKFSHKVRDVSEWLAQKPFIARLEKLMPENEKAPASTCNRSSATTSDVARETVPNISVATQRAEKVAATEADQQTFPPKNQAPQTQNGEEKITYHDACHLAHGQGVRVPPRELVQSAANSEGIEMVPLDESDMCCGSAGTYNILQPEMADRLLERKMENIRRTGAQTVVSSNPGCTMQLKMGAQKFKVPVEILHPVEILDRATGE